MDNIISLETFSKRYSSINKEYRTILDNFLKLIQPKIINKKFIRIGSVNDGGYVMVDNFEKTDYLISMGIGGDIEFETDILKKISGADLYDEVFEDLNDKLTNYRFFNESIGVNNQQTTLESCINRVNTSKDLILKMDIEGSEWDLLDNINSSILNNFKQMVIEFHLCRKFLLPERFKYEEYQKAIRVFNKINETHYPVHAHLNTWGSLFYYAGQIVPNTFEMTYIRKDMVDDVYDRIRSDAEMLDSPNSELHNNIFFPYT